MSKRGDDKTHANRLRRFVVSRHRPPSLATTRNGIAVAELMCHVRRWSRTGRPVAEPSRQSLVPHGPTRRWTFRICQPVTGSERVNPSPDPNRSTQIDTFEKKLKLTHILKLAHTQERTHILVDPQSEADTRTDADTRTEAYPRAEAGSQTEADSD